MSDTKTVAIADVYRETADRIAIECNAPDAGVAVTVDLIPGTGYRYCIWSFAKAGLNNHHLFCEHTSEERLKSHILGFIDNVRSAA